LIGEPSHWGSLWIADFIPMISERIMWPFFVAYTKAWSRPIMLQILIQLRVWRDIKWLRLGLPLIYGISEKVIKMQSPHTLKPCMLERVESGLGLQGRLFFDAN
jgi:hypothetical protein